MIIQQLVKIKLMETYELRITGPLSAIPTQRVSNAERVSVCHDVIMINILRSKGIFHGYMIS